MGRFQSTCCVTTSSIVLPSFIGLLVTPAQKRGYNKHCSQFKALQSKLQCYYRQRLHTLYSYLLNEYNTTVLVGISRYPRYHRHNERLYCCFQLITSLKLRLMLGLFIHSQTPTFTKQAKTWNILICDFAL
jgi:hypothetical protein